MGVSGMWWWVHASVVLEAGLGSGGSEGASGRNGQRLGGMADKQEVVAMVGGWRISMMTVATWQCWAL